MNPDSIHTSAKDTKRWPAYNESVARAVLVDRFTSEPIKNACRLLLGGMRVNDALKAAEILSREDDEMTAFSQSSVINRLRTTLREMGVLA